MKRLYRVVIWHNRYKDFYTKAKSPKEATEKILKSYSGGGWEQTMANSTRLSTKKNAHLLDNFVK